MGGTSTLPYPFEFNDILKTKVRERDNNKCKLCGAPQAEFERKLSVHHIDYNKKNCAMENLITLCSGCNSKVNHSCEQSQSYFESLMRKEYGYNYKKTNKISSMGGK